MSATKAALAMGSGALRDALGPEVATIFRKMVGEVEPDIKIIEIRGTDLCFALVGIRQTLGMLSAVLPQMSGDIGSLFRDVERCINSIVKTTRSDQIDKLNYMKILTILQDRKLHPEEDLIKRYTAIKDDPALRHIVVTGANIKSHIGDKTVDADIFLDTMGLLSFSKHNLSATLSTMVPKLRDIVSQLLSRWIDDASTINKIQTTPDINPDEFKQLLLTLLNSMSIDFGSKYGRGIDILRKYILKIGDNVDKYYIDMVNGSDDGTKNPFIMLESMSSDILAESGKSQRDPIAESQLVRLMIEIKAKLGQAKEK